ncbi:MAG: hypothetical protein KatS3mg011_0610 [Acidimicrobiia bacterium]|nr:MAG: hypothetical protein KatS3mg011_0610 [Acidimicrobiia bacterium]
MLWDPHGEGEMLVQYFNHVPNARRMATGVSVSWGGPSTIGSVVDGIRRRGWKRVGVIGPVGWALADAIREIAEIRSLDRGYLNLRLVKSGEEIAWMRRGAELSDRAVVALRDGLRPGIDERQMGAIVEAAYLADGGTNHIHYFGVTSMEDPDCCVPAQWPSTRRVRAGDVVFTEISASWWGYAGQVLRTMFVSSPPTPLYSELHEVASAAYRAVLDRIRPGASCDDLIAAADLIEDAGFSIYDDLIHGYGGGYLPPVLRTRHTSHTPPPDLRLASGMTLVVQPNVITPDERAGVQTGGLVLVTDDGVEELQQAPPGPWIVG